MKNERAYHSQRAGNKKFKIKRVRVYQPQPRQIVEGWPKRDGGQKYIVYASDFAIQKIEQHARRDTSNECFGLLLGNAYRDYQKDVLWIHLQDSIAAEDTHASPDSVEVSTSEFKRLNEQVDAIRDKTNDQIRKIGWYHSHPDVGIFMSRVDRINQRQFYPQEWQIALVVDPIRDKMGFFRGAHSTQCDYTIISDAESRVLHAEEMDVSKQGEATLDKESSRKKTPLTDLFIKVLTFGQSRKLPRHEIQKQLLSLAQDDSLSGEMKTRLLKLTIDIDPKSRHARRASVLMNKKQ